MLLKAVVNEKAELPFLKAARLSIETRDFPSLSYDRFGFILFLIFFPEIICEKVALSQWNSVAQTIGERKNHWKNMPGKEYRGTSKNSRLLPKT